MWGILKEVESGIAAESEQVRLEQSESSVLRPLWPLPPLLSLCKEETSGSLRSVKRLSLLLVVFKGTLSLEDWPLSWLPSRQSMSCNLDQRRLLHSKVHLSLIANRSSSSESSLWGNADYVTSLIYFIFNKSYSFILSKRSLLLSELVTINTIQFQRSYRTYFHLQYGNTITETDVKITYTAFAYFSNFADSTKHNLHIFPLNVKY